MSGPADEPPAAAPSIKICTVDGQYVHLRATPAEHVMALLEELRDSDVETLSFDLDDGRSQCHVLRANVCRVDVDWQLSRWHRFTSWCLVKLDRWL